MSVSTVASESGVPALKVPHKNTLEAPNNPKKLEAAPTTYVNESYHVNKDGDSYSFNYNKTTVTTGLPAPVAMDPQAKELLKGFNMSDFQEKIKSDLLEMVFQSNEKAKENTNQSLIEKYGSDVIYEVPDETEAAEVPEFWNAENTAQRLVDFAMSFKSVSGVDDDAEYIEEVRDAVIEGFRQAKGIIGEVSDPTHKLFNDTFDLTMQKFDTLLEEYQSNKQATAPQTLDMVA